MLPTGQRNPFEAPHGAGLKAYQLAATKAVDLSAIRAVLAGWYPEQVINRLRTLAARLFRRRRAVSPEDAAALAIEHYRAGVDAYGQRKFRQAVREFTIAIYMAPGHAGMFQHRGAALAELGKLAQAINDYDRAVHLNPSFPDTYLDRGNAYHALGDTEKAIRDYGEALRLKPDYPEAHANRAAAYIESGRELEGNRDADRAIALGIDRAALEALLNAARTGPKRGKKSR